LSWSIKGAISATMNGKDISLEDFIIVSDLRKDTTFVFIAKSDNGVESVSKTITIAVIPTHPVLSVSITATPDTIMKGETTRIDWNSEGPAVSLTSNVPGLNGLSGSITDGPSETVTYFVIVKGQNGKIASSSVTITVIEILPPEGERILALGPLKEFQQDIYLKDSLIFSLDTAVECRKDDRWIFYLNHKLQLYQGTMLCDDELVNTDPFDWRLSADTLFGLGEPRIIKLLTPDTLRWEFKSRYQSQNGTVLPTRVVQAFVRR